MSSKILVRFHFLTAFENPKFIKIIIFIPGSYLRYKLTMLAYIPSDAAFWLNYVFGII